LNHGIAGDAATSAACLKASWVELWRQQVYRVATILAILAGCAPVMSFTKIVVWVSTTARIYRRRKRSNGDRV
jgi:hypothetical protein